MVYLSRFLTAGEKVRHRNAPRCFDVTQGGRLGGEARDWGALRRSEIAFFGRLASFL